MFHTVLCINHVHWVSPITHNVYRDASQIGESKQ